MLILEGTLHVGYNKAEITYNRTSNKTCIKSEHDLDSECSGQIITWKD